MIDYKALKGDPTDNIPGVPGVGEKTAAKLDRDLRHARRAVRAPSTRSSPRSCAIKLSEHREVVLESRELMRLVRDLPVDARPRARAGSATTTATTVIRLFREYEFRTLIDRLPPMPGEAPEDAVARAARDRRRRRRPRARPGSPAGADRRARDRAATASSSGSTSMRSAGAAAEPDDTADERGRPTATCRARWPPRSRTRDDSRSEARTSSTTMSSRGWRPRATVGVALVASTIRGHAAASRSPSPSRGRTGGRSSRRRPRRSARLLRSHRHERRPARRARGEADPDGPVRGRPRIRAAPGRLRHPDRGLRPQRRAPEPDDRRRRRRAARPVLPPVPKDLDPATLAGLEALAAARRRDRRSSARSPRTASSACSPRSSCRSSRSSPGWRRPASRSTSRRSAALDREFGTEIARLEAEIYAAVGHEFTIGCPKQLGEILFEELHLPKAARPRPATRPTRPCSRSCAASIR